MKMFQRGCASAHEGVKCHPGEKKTTVKKCLGKRLRKGGKKCPTPRFKKGGTKKKKPYRHEA